jgi:hypothetical protein
MAYHEFLDGGGEDIERHVEHAELAPDPAHARHHRLLRLTCRRRHGLVVVVVGVGQDEDHLVPPRVGAAAAAAALLLDGHHHLGLSGVGVVVRGRAALAGAHHELLELQPASPLVCPCTRTRTRTHRMRRWQRYAGP